MGKEGDLGLGGGGRGEGSEGGQGGLRLAEDGFLYIDIPNLLEEARFFICRILGFIIGII